MPGSAFVSYKVAPQVHPPAVRDEKAQHQYKNIKCFKTIQTIFNFSILLTQPFQICGLQSFVVCTIFVNSV